MSHGYFAATSGGTMSEEMDMMWADHEFRLANPDKEAISREIELSWLDVDQQRADNERIERLWHKITLDAFDAATALEIRGIEFDNFAIAKGVALLHGVSYGDKGISWHLYDGTDEHSHTSVASIISSAEQMLDKDFGQNSTYNDEDPETALPDTDEMDAIIAKQRAEQIDAAWAMQPEALTALEIVWGRIAIASIDMLESKLNQGEEIDAHSIAVESAMAHGIDFNCPNIVIDSEGIRHYDTTVVGLTAIRINKIMSRYCTQHVSTRRFAEITGGAEEMK